MRLINDSDQDFISSLRNHHILLLLKLLHLQLLDNATADTINTCLEALTVDVEAVYCFSMLPRLLLLLREGHLSFVKAAQGCQILVDTIAARA